ncbi:hypothetical protein DPMN_001494 [Dreissena polymorpha]|uniref:Uncharacterized protein n=1 Tax=Dreissena polymorpha TaxID=45954 RepID=A0A9D4RQW6_DREPO|nr:hypothetical protein DPMN_001494 [Dreissena polymorpha]
MIPASIGSNSDVVLAGKNCSFTLVNVICGWTGSLSRLDLPSPQFLPAELHYVWLVGKV